ncbi:O-methyltransferase [Brevibacterium luteolum]|uniref:O-methyltransferase n=1 Tax=Brevibacterium luteolum TaxID=199591 RepID=UPI0020C7E3FD
MTGQHEHCPPAEYDDTAAWAAVDRFFEDQLVVADEALVAAERSSERTTMPHAAVSAGQGRLLGLIAQLAGARRVLEFGTLAGYSTIWLAHAVGPGGRVVTLELEESNAEVARENVERAGVSDRVEVFVGPAAESAGRLIATGAEPFDLVFIDADKPNNPRYLEASLTLTRPGAVIIIDNVVRDGAVIDPDSADPKVHGVRTVTEMIAGHPELEATAVQTVGGKGWDGFILARRI